MIIIDELLLITAVISLIISLLKRKNSCYFLYFSAVIIIAWLFIRTILTHHAPFSNVFETVVMFSSIYLVKLSFSESAVKNSIYTKMPGILLLITALFFPLSMREYRALPEILNSFWFYIHVPSYFIGYVSLLFAFSLTAASFFSPERKQGKSGINLEIICLRELKLSVFFMTVGLFSGAAWANLSWSHFWGWDPKEIWALITWLLTFLTIHFKNKKLRAFFILLAFLSMIFTYFGVSFLLAGLHSYT